MDKWLDIRVPLLLFAGAVAAFLLQNTNAIIGAHVSWLLVCARSNGIMDAIMFARTHFGTHPYSDFWHWQKYLMYVSLAFWGATLAQAATLNPWWLLLLLLAVPAKLVVWNPHAALLEKYFIIDESLEISIEKHLPDAVLNYLIEHDIYIDKFFGFHH